MPYLSIAASDSDVEEESEAGLEVNGNTLLWTMGGASFVSEWNYPTVLQSLQGNSNWTEEQRVIELTEADQWVYMVVQSAFAQDHPIHLHGHDFWVLDQGYGKYVNGSDTLKLNNAPRRDVAMLPASGFLVIAFKTDNPGVSQSYPSLAPGVLDTDFRHFARRG